MLGILASLCIAAIFFLIVVMIVKLVLAELEASPGVRKIVLLVLLLLFLMVLCGYFAYYPPDWPPVRRVP